MDKRNNEIGSIASCLKLFGAGVLLLAGNAVFHPQKIHIEIFNSLALVPVCIPMIQGHAAKDLKFLALAGFGQEAIAGIYAHEYRVILPIGALQLLILAGGYLIQSFKSRVNRDQAK